jgi:L-ascorbate metabolism protein UlaG (beta-lactamase superfamily)
MATLRITLISVPTALLKASDFRVLTDPTFDPPGQYHLAHTTLKKTAGPALTPQAVGKIDAVLLSHDLHADNFDHARAAFLARAGQVLTTLAGAQRLGDRVAGMMPWQTVELRPWGSGRGCASSSQASRPLSTCSNSR